MTTAQPTPPSRVDLEVRFAAVLSGSAARDEVGRWAAQILLDLEDAEVDEAVWWALDILAGIDLCHGPDAPYLHDDAQLSGWLAEFRNRCDRTG